MHSAPIPIRVVLTGAPGAGKSTTLASLAQLGCATVREAARELIATEQMGDNLVYPWTDLSRFVERLSQIQIQEFTSLGYSAPIVFFDRGLPDALAFLRFHHASPSVAYVNACSRFRYTYVFNLQLPAAYRADAQRPYSPIDARTLGDLNREEYLRLGYSLIEIPPLSAKERASLILSQVLSQSSLALNPFVSSIAPASLSSTLMSPPRRGSGALILNERNEVLLLMRGPACRNDAGLWSQPGGALEEPDCPAERAKREAEEELGVQIEIQRLLCATIHSDAATSWLAYSYLGKIAAGIPTLREPHKHNKFQWFALNALPSNLNLVTSESTEILKKQLTVRRG